MQVYSCLESGARTFRSSGYFAPVVVGYTFSCGALVGAFLMRQIIRKVGQTLNQTGNCQISQTITKIDSVAKKVTLFGLHILFGTLVCGSGTLIHLGLDSGCASGHMKG